MTASFATGGSATPATYSSPRGGAAPLAAPKWGAGSEAPAIANAILRAVAAMTMGEA